MNYVTLNKILEKGGVSLDEFMKVYWGKRPLLIKSAFENPDDLLCLSTFMNEFESPESSWTFNPIKTDEIDSELVYEASASTDVFERENIQSSSARIKLRKQGYYFYCQPSRNMSPGLCGFISSIQNTLKSLTDNYIATFFYSESGVGYTEEHTDAYENFVLQMYGSKRWVIGTEASNYKLTVMQKNKDEFYCTDSIQHRRVLAKSEVVKERQEIITQPGDFLYIPTYTTHEVFSDNELNISLSVFRDPQNFVDTLLKLSSDQDFTLNGLLEKRFVLPIELTEIKTSVCTQIANILSRIKSNNLNFYDHLGRILSSTDHESFSTSHLDSIVETTFGCRDNFNINSHLKRNPIFSSHYIMDSSDHSDIKFYINSEEFTFDGYKFGCIGEVLQSDREFTIKNVIKNCKNAGESDWHLLRKPFEQMIKKKYLIIS
ncbi:MAG: cupin-like domain-containing protein [Oligoflexales bacterium]|nr:cupin-like domain-containing protein [Oligoflexales bacterium]